MIPTEQIPEEFDAQEGFSIDSTVHSGCRVGGFPGIAQFMIGSDVPEEMRAEFPEGSALRFVFDGDRVGVFLSSAIG